jgi:hypothetical protein
MVTFYFDAEPQRRREIPFKTNSASWRLCVVFLFVLLEKQRGVGTAEAE